MREKFLIFGSPKIERAEIEEVIACLESGWIGTGARVKRFEDDFMAYKKARNAVAVNSCTAGLHISLLAAGLGSGDEVITTPMTFCATVNAIIHAGATPVLADVESNTMNIDPSRVENAITSKTRAIIPVHFAGRPCKMDALCEISNRYGLKIIEDCAHSIESQYKGKEIGTFGDFGCFSFYVTKNIITGEGGMILTREEKDASRLKALALHGMSKDAWSRFGDQGYKHYQVVECGFKYNMMDLQAAIGIHQLQRIEKYWKRRCQIWNRYNEAFSTLPLELPEDPETGTRHAYHLYTIMVDEAKAGISRDDFLDALTERKIGAGVHYLSIPEHPFYQHSFGWKPEDFPNSMRIGRQTVSLPISAKLSDNDVEDVIDAVVKILS